MRTFERSVRPATPRGTPRPLLASLTGLIAISAYAGAIALATRMTDLGAAVEGRLPFGSTVFAGLALALIVAIPMTVATRQAAIGGPGITNAAITAGALLVGWIVIEIAVIRTFSWLQPTLAAAGAGVLLAGLWPRLRRPVD